MARTRQSPFNSLLSIGCLGRAGKISEALNNWSLGSAGSLKKFFCALGTEEAGNKFFRLLAGGVLAYAAIEGCGSEERAGHPSDD